MKFTPRTYRVKRKPARRITNTELDAINILYGPQESHVQDDEELKPVITVWLPSRGIEKERIGGQDA